MRHRQKTNKETASLLAFWLPILAVALLGAFIALFWEEHDPGTKEPETETQQEVQAETEEETESEAETEADSAALKAREALGAMSLEEKTAQLFFITPEALTGVEVATASLDSTKEAYDTYPVGGIIYFEQNIVSEEQFKEMTSGMRRISEERSQACAFLGIDEEGGRVARLANHEGLDIENVGPMLAIGQSGDVQKAREAGETIGAYLQEFGLDVDFAPDADVLDAEDNTVIADRSFGTDPSLAADMVAEMVEGLKSEGISATLKHFPGHGATKEDTHTEAAYTQKTMEELWQSDFLPFQAGIEAGADFVMVGHLAAPNATGEDTPAIFSEALVEGVLREQMGFEGIIITDALNMDAIMASYTSAQAAVKALQAGVDMLLMPADFTEAYQGVLDAVADGTLTQERIDESVLRILTLKFQK